MTISPSSKQPSLLETIQSPADIKALSSNELEGLAQEIRELLIASISVTGGHLAPNLGIVELSLALHRSFDTPHDKILFDVSHQSYVHKILTGRAQSISSIRQFGGISGFMKRSESEHDAFGAGHAGTALSAAVGMAAARDLKEEDYDVVAVVGDAAFSCGPSLEALNHASDATKRLIVILNDNRWSIERNVGALSQYFTSLQQSETYSWIRSFARSFVEKLGGNEAREQASKLLKAAHGLVTPLSFFEQLGFTYYGPVDGHDIERMERILRVAKKRTGPAIIHVITEKGRGYAPAANNPPQYHGVGSYNPTDGKPHSNGQITYSEVFGQQLAQMAQHDKCITAITAAMPTGTKLSTFRDAHPKRFYDVGIAEEHAAIFACGQASQGLKPYLAIYSTFMQRCVDMIQHDASLQKLPVRFCMDRAGLSPDDGPTHHGVFDIAMLRCIPDLIMMQPKDEAELCHMLATMNEIEHCPSSIRYPRGVGEGVPLPEKASPLPLGKAELIHDAGGGDISLIALGNMNAIAAQTRELLEAQGHKVTHINARFIKPLDAQMILEHARKSRLIATLEDHCVSGGFGSAVLELLNKHNVKTPVITLAWPDQYVEHGTLELLRHKHGLTAQNLFDKIKEKLSS